MAEAAEKKEGTQESPSMEEILKSIRGVISGEESEESAETADEEILELTEMEIAEDQAPAATDATSSTTADSTGGEKSVLDEIDAAIGVDNVPEQVAAVELQPEPIAAPQPEPEPEPEPEPIAEPELDEVAETQQESDVLEASGGADVVDGIEPAKTLKSNEPLLKEKVVDESSETLRTLVNNIPRTHVSSPYTKGGVTLEDLTIEAMRPFLAEWLNQNLPVIVKQIVSKEIKKLIPQDDEK